MNTDGEQAPEGEEHPETPVEEYNCTDASWQPRLDSDLVTMSDDVASGDSPQDPLEVFDSATPSLPVYEVGVGPPKANLPVDALASAIVPVTMSSYLVYHITLQTA